LTWWEVPVVRCGSLGTAHLGPSGLWTYTMRWDTTAAPGRLRVYANVNCSAGQRERRVLGKAGSGKTRSRPGAVRPAAAGDSKASDCCRSRRALPTRCRWRRAAPARAAYAVPSSRQREPLGVPSIHARTFMCADGLRNPCPYPVGPSKGTPNTLHGPSCRVYPARVADRIPRTRSAACDVRS